MGSWFPRALVALLGASSLTLVATTAAGAALGSVSPVRAAISVPAPGTTFITPADGRLRGQDFAANVTGVAWPDRAIVNGQTVVATPGHRFVAFNLELTEDASAVAPDGSDPAVTAAVTYGTTSSPLSLTAVNAQIADHALQSTWPSGSASFVVSVPNTIHAVDLVLLQGSFSQSFDLWTLHRDATVPSVLYRGTDRPTLSSPTAASTTLSLSNPSDGFSGIAEVAVPSATLSFFAAPDAGVPVIAPDQSILSVTLTAKYPVNLNDATATGHYLGAQAPLPASFLSFTPTGAAPVSATLSESGSTTGQADDDGLFDALYSFVVPASLTSGTLTIAAGSFTGTEFTLYTAEDGSTTVNVTAPATMTIQFPAVPISAPQKRPPWFGAALPPTAAPSTGTNQDSPLDASTGGGLPIGVAVLILVGVVGVLVVGQRVRQQRGLRWSFPWTNTSPASTAFIPLQDPGVPSATHTTASAPADSPHVEVTEFHATPASAPAVPAPTVPTATATPAATTDLTVNVLGPVEVIGWRQVPERRVTEGLLCFLLFHDTRPMSAEQIQLAVWPTGEKRVDISRKSFLNYLSTLRRCVGSDHLPDAVGAGGYRLTGVGSDWTTFVRLTALADKAAEPEAIALRTEAMTLVRGTPFEGAEGDHYDWVLNEHLATTMTVAVASTALTLATAHQGNGDHGPAEAAARSGLAGAADDFALWRIGAQAIHARGDTTALRRWLGDAARHLSPADIGRIEASLDSHPGSDTA